MYLGCKSGLKARGKSKLSQRQKKELATEEQRTLLKSMRKAVRGHAVVCECKRQAIRWPSVVTLAARAALTSNPSQTLNRQ